MLYIYSSDDYVLMKTKIMFLKKINSKYLLGINII